MIIVQLKGGLGNQMFQYAAGRSLADKLNTKLFMDLSWFEAAASADTPRVYELGCYRVQENFINPGRFTLIDKYEPSLRSRIYRYTKGLKSPYVINHRETSHNFNPGFFKLSGNTYLDGYWQSEKYFNNIRSILLNDFKYKKSPSSGNAELLKDIGKLDSISLHVRRGDYVNNKSTNAFHGLTGLDYYKDAVSKVTKKINEPTFFIFSDEPEWCKKNLKINYPVVYISHNQDGAEDMRLMRHCKHNIIANSSFSWWGAWLNDNPAKIVIAPEKWFNDPSVNTSDVIPKEWIKI